MEGLDESIGRRSLRTLSSQFVGRFGSMLISIVAFIIVARLLGPANYGIYTLAVSIYSFVGAVGHFGIGTYFNKHIAEYIYEKRYDKINRVISAGYYILFPIAFLLMLVGLFGSGLIASYFKSQSLPIITVMISSVVLFFSMLYGALYPALVSFGRGRWAAYNLVIVQFINLVGSVILILMGLSYNGALIGLMLSYIAGFALAHYYIKRSMKPFGGLRFVKVMREEIGEALSFSIPIAANNFVNNSVNNFGTMLLGIFATSIVLGNYGVAMKGLNLLQSFYGTMSVVLLPTFSAILARKRRIEAAYNKVLLYSLIIILPIIVYVGVFAKPLIFILVTRNYYSAPLYLLLISIGVALGLPALYTSSLLVGAGKVMKVLKYNAVSAIIQFASLIYLIPRFGAIGAILSIFIIGGVINDVLFIYGVRKVFGIRLRFYKLVYLFAANLLLGIFMLPAFLLRGNFAVAIAGLLVGIILYPIILSLMQIIGREFIEDLKRFSEGIPIIENISNLIISYIKHFVR